MAFNHESSRLESLNTNASALKSNSWNLNVKEKRQNLNAKKNTQ